MLPKSALILLFEYDFGNGVLFKNQIDLVNKLLSNPRSSFYTENEDDKEYNRVVSKTKAYISQLLSETSRRSITPEFHESLRSVIKDRLLSTKYDYSDIVDSIIEDLKSINKKFVFQHNIITHKKSNISGEFIKEIISANYISVFTAREIQFEFYALDKTISFVEFLLEDLIRSYQENKKIKFYRFNFPLEQTCNLFWRGLKKEMTKYLKNNKSLFVQHLSLYHFRFESDKVTGKPNEEEFATNILTQLSKSGNVNVFHLKAPIYIVPSVTFNPNEGIRSSTYLFLQSSNGNDIVHKLNSEEQVLWKLFAWDNLKKNKSGTLIPFSPEF